MKIVRLEDNFGDQCITTKLLNMLKIENRCLLRGDYYHLMKEVFPTSEFLGTHVMNTIEKNFRNMLLASKEDKWNAPELNNDQFATVNLDLGLTILRDEIETFSLSNESK